jgi:hypothetical protein
MAKATPSTNSNWFKAFVIALETLKTYKPFESRKTYSDSLAKIESFLEKCETKCLVL